MGNAVLETAPVDDFYLLLIDATSLNNSLKILFYHPGLHLHVHVCYAPPTTTVSYLLFK